MNSTSRFIAALCVAAGAALVVPAAAQPPPPAGPKAKERPSKARIEDKKAGAKARALERKEARKERAEDRKEARKERAEDRKEARKERAEDRKEALAKRREAFSKRMQELRKTRKDRRKARRAAFKKRWGEKAHKQAAIRAELRRHSWRMARLNRIRYLAEAEGKDELLAKVEKLSSKEHALHEKRLEKLKADKGHPGAKPDDLSKSPSGKGPALDKGDRAKPPLPAPVSKGAKPPAAKPPAAKPQPPTKSTEGTK